MAHYAPGKDSKTYKAIASSAQHPVHQDTLLISLLQNVMAARLKTISANDARTAQMGHIYKAIHCALASQHVILRSAGRAPLSVLPGITL